MKRTGFLPAVLSLSSLLAVDSARGGDPDPWTVLAPGLELGEFPVDPEPGIGDGVITVLRIDASSWELGLYCAADPSLSRESPGGSGVPANRTARAWCRDAGLVAAINAGMFAQDYTTHVGYLAAGDYVNNDNVNGYESVAVFGSLLPDGPPFRIFDRDDGAEVVLLRRSFRHLVQNLRLIKRPGENRWSRQKKRWSEAALGEDAEGRALFLFCGTPYTMHHLNRLLIGLPIGLIAAQHLEGGPEAQLYVKVGGFEREWKGVFETGFFQGDGTGSAWPVPNVIGVRGRE